MQIGVIGLGRMGGNIVRRLIAKGKHHVVVWDKDARAIQALASDGATASTSITDMIGKLKAPRVIWVMLPAGKITEDTVTTLGQSLQSGDTIIDGGNTFWQDDVRRAQALKEKGIHYIDVGTSGGIWGYERGYCMMIGGDKGNVDRLDPTRQDAYLRGRRRHRCRAAAPARARQRRDQAQGRSAQ